MRWLYNLSLHLALPLMLLRLWWRGRREPGYRVHWAQRFGQGLGRIEGGVTAPKVQQREEQRTQQRPADDSAAPLIWLHAVSLGETRAAQPLVAALRLRYPQHRWLITHMTATGRAAAHELYGAFAECAWLPYDLPWAMKAFFRHHRPAIGIVMETEVWPNLVRAAGAHQVPLLLANARLSERSAKSYRRFAALARPAFAALNVAAQTDADAARLISSGATRVTVTGNLKFDFDAPPDTAERAAALRRLFGGRRVLLASSTREGEEALLLATWTAMPADSREGVLLVIVPRHPQRFDEVARLMGEQGLPVVRRSNGVPVPAECSVMLGDSMGELSAYYAASDIAFVGGSLVALGGQNLIEACAQGVPVLLGPHTFNFSQAADDAVAGGAALRVSDAGALLATAQALLADVARCRRMGAAGRAFCAAHRGATARTVVAVEEILQGR